VRAGARVEDRIVFKDNDGGFDRVQRRAAARQHGPARFERAPAARQAVRDRFVRNVPRAAVNDQGWRRRIVGLSQEIFRT